MIRVVVEIEHDNGRTAYEQACKDRDGDATSALGEMLGEAVSSVWEAAREIAEDNSSEQFLHGFLVSVRPMMRLAPRECEEIICLQIADLTRDDQLARLQELAKILSSLSQAASEAADDLKSSYLPADVR